MFHGIDTARWWSLVFVVAVAIAFRLAVALALPYDGGTDERRRYPVVAYLYRHGQVPRYGDAIPEAQGFTARPVLPFRLAAWVARLVPEALPRYVAFRFSAVLLSALTVVLAYGCSQYLWPKDWLLAAAAAAVVAFHPQFLYVGSYLNGDAYTVFANTAVFSVLCAIHRRGAQVRLLTAAALGVALGLVFLGRQNGYVGFILAAGYGFYLLRANFRPNVGLLGVSLAVFLVFPTAFYLNQYRTLGIAYVPFLVGSGVAWVPPGWSVEQAYAQPALSQGLDYPVVRARWFDPVHWFLYLSALFPSSFGVFGYMDVFLPSPLYSWYLVFLAGGAVGLARWQHHRRRASVPQAASRQWLLSSAAVAVAGMLLVVTYHNFAVLYQPQGRYLLPVLVPSIFLLLLGWRQLSVQAAFHRTVTALASTFFVVSGTYATWLLLARSI